MSSLKFNVSCLIPLILLISSGCGGSGGVERHALEGTVTFDGKPVPYGRISFEPDRTRGGSGPAGIAEIREGAFSTDNRGGKGSVSGPMKVQIQGYPSDQPFTPELFRTYTEAIEVTGDAELKFEVPAEYKLQPRKPQVREFEG